VRASTERDRPDTWPYGAVAAVGLVAFVAIAALVQARLLVGVDLAAAQAKQVLISRPLDLWSAAVGIAISGEFSVVYAAIGAFLLWRAGLGRWSLAPLTFLGLVVLELGLKIVIQQPAVPAEFYRGAYYPLTDVTLQGTFPSGHAIRAAFLCAFAAVLLARRGGLVGRLSPIVLGALALLMSLSRVYMGYHWLSDVVAGMILGVALALLVAPPVARRIGARPLIILNRE
ncbi:MAG: phosphatase PAP2 family protein, partial [Chloroflexota bacterium]